MAESKTYVFGQDANNGMLNLLLPLFQRQGLDPNMVLAMTNRGGFGGEGGCFMAMLFFFFLLMFNGDGFGNFGNRGNSKDKELANLINNNDGRDLIMQAIQGNANAINQLSSTLGCSVGQVQQAINALMGQVQQVGGQIGMSSQQIINAVQAGKCDIAQQLASCCCENRLSICQQTNTLQQSINNVVNSQERGFGQVSTEMYKQTCEVRDAIRENTAQVLAGQRAAEMREMGRELAERDRKIAEQAVIINNGQQTAIFGQMIQQATAPIVAAVGAVQKDVDCMKCKLPETATIPYSPVVGVPACVAAQYGLALGINGTFPGAWG